MVKILFVDDEKNLLDGLKRMLRKKKDEWEMNFVLSGHDAFELIRNGEYHVVITDYKMPGMDGLDLLQKVKEFSPDTKRIILSGQSKSEIYDKAKEIAHDYVSKPSTPEALITVIEKAIKPAGKS